MVFLIIGVLCRINIWLSRNWVSTAAPFVAVCLTNCGKVVYIQFIKTLCRLDKDIILGRIMYDMKMHYTYCVVLIWNDTLHSDVQCEFLEIYCIQSYNIDFLKEYTIFSHIVRILMKCTVFGHTMWILKGCTIFGHIARIF